MKEKHIPLRMCAACRIMRPQSELIRFVSSEGGARLDAEKKLFGRGAYLCRDKACIKKAEKKNILSRHLGCAFPKELYDAAREMIPVSD